RTSGQPDTGTGGRHGEGDDRRCRRHYIVRRVFEHQRRLDGQGRSRGAGDGGLREQQLSGNVGDVEVGTGRGRQAGAGRHEVQASVVRGPVTARERISSFAIGTTAVRERLTGPTKVHRQTDGV